MKAAALTGNAAYAVVAVRTNGAVLTLPAQKVSFALLLL